MSAGHRINRPDARIEAKPHIVSMHQNLTLAFETNVVDEAAVKRREVAQHSLSTIIVDDDLGVPPRDTARLHIQCNRRIAGQQWHSAFETGAWAFIHLECQVALWLSADDVAAASDEWEGLQIRAEVTPCSHFRALVGATAAEPSVGVQESAGTVE